MNLGLFLNLTCPLGVASLYSKLLRIFSSGVNGAIYEPGDIATLYQDSARTTPVTVVTNPVGSISDKSGNLNYAIQATAAARPTWTNRVNLLTYTEQFDNAAWIKYNATVSANSVIAPDGTITADTFTTTGTVSAVLCRPFATQGAAAAWSVNAKQGTNRYLALVVGDGAADAGYVVFDLQTGAVGQTVSGTETTNVSGAITQSSNGFYRCTIFYTRVSSVNLKIEFAPALNGNTLDANGEIVGNSIGNALYIWGAQLEYGTSATRYQRVTTATDFDTVGFPYYLSFLGVDDSLTSATGGGGSAGFFWCGVVQPTGGAGTLQTLFADNGTNTGYKVQKDVNNKLSFSAGNNAAFTTKVSTATVAVGTKDIWTVWDDGTNLNVQIGSAAAETVARPVVVAGTAGYTLCKDNGAASSFFIGNLYPSVYFRDTAGTAAERAAAQAYCKAEGGM